MTVKAKIVFFLIILLVSATGNSSYSRTPHPHIFYIDSCRYDVKKYRIDISLSDTSTYINARVAITCKATADLDRVYFEFNSALRVDSLSLNGIGCKYRLEDDLLTVTPVSAIKADNHFTLQLSYQGIVEAFGMWGGFRNETDYRYRNRITWSLSEPFFAYAWFPCKQDLTDKIDTVAMNISVPDSLKAAGNGLLTHVEKKPGGTTCYHWLSTYPMAYYLVFAACGNYQEYSYRIPYPDYYPVDGITGATRLKKNKDSLLVQNYIYNIPGLVQQYQYDLDRTGEIIRLYSRLLGDYPFRKEKYGHVMAPFSGGMEHQTMSLMYYFEFHLVAHELAHQWFGNYVTCSDWQNIFINESLASYCEYLAHEYLQPDDVKKWLDKSRSLALSEPEGSVFVPAKDSTNDDRIFSYELSYKKGALVLHMLRKEIGNDEVFFSALRSFLERHKYATASIRDFQKVFEEKTGKSFQLFFDQWVFGSGYPIYHLRHKVKGNKLIIRLEQKTSSKNTPLFNTGIELLIADDNGERIEKIYPSKNNEKYQTTIQGHLNKLVLDPDNNILKKTNDTSRPGKNRIRYIESGN